MNTWLVSSSPPPPVEEDAQTLTFQDTSKQPPEVQSLRQRGLHYIMNLSNNLQIDFAPDLQNPIGKTSQATYFTFQQPLSVFDFCLYLVGLN